MLGPRARVVVSALLLLAAAALPPGLRAQGRDNWYDVYPEEKKAIENDAAGQDRWKLAVGRLETALRTGIKEGSIPADGGDGRYATYSAGALDDFFFHFYIGWGYMRLNQPEKALRALDRSEQVGFLKQKRADLHATLQRLLGKASKIGPAENLLRQARQEGKPCLEQARTLPVGAALMEGITKLETVLLQDTSAEVIEASMNALRGTLTGCREKLAEVEIANLGESFKLVRAALSVPDLERLLTGSTAASLRSLLFGTSEAEQSRNADAFKKAVGDLKGLHGTVSSEVAGAMSRARQDAERWLPGNRKTLDGEMQGLGRKIQEKLDEAAAVGNPGLDLAQSVPIVLALKELVDRAAGGFPAIRDAKKTDLSTARSAFEGWLQANRCALDAVGGGADASRVHQAAAQALSDSSADAMTAAAAELRAMTARWAPKVGTAMPAMLENAKNAIAAAEGVLPMLQSEATRTSGQDLVAAVSKAVESKDLCGGEAAIARLEQFVEIAGPDAIRAINAAKDRNRPILQSAREYLAFAGFASGSETAEIREEAGKLESLLGKRIIPVDSVDGSGRRLQELLSRWLPTLREKLIAQLRRFRSLKGEACWARIDRNRRQWLVAQEPAITAAADTLTNHEILGRFSRDSLRAEVECRLISAHGGFHDGKGAAEAAKLLESIDPAAREGSATLNYSLSFFYWWQAKETSGGDAGGWIEKAREAYARGLRLLPAGPGSASGLLYSPDFIREMGGGSPPPGGGL